MLSVVGVLLLTDIKAFEAFEILIFEVVGLIEIWCGFLYFVMYVESKV